MQRQVEMEDADVPKGSGTKSRDKNYYSSANHNPYNDAPAYTMSNRSHSYRRYSAKLDGSGEHGFHSSKSSRPQSRDCRLHGADKTRDCDKIGPTDGDYNPDSGGENTLIDDDRKLNVFVNNSELDELVSIISCLS